MSTISKVRIPAPSDRRVLEFFEKVAGSHSGISFDVQVPGANLGGFSTFQDFASKFDGDWGRSKLLGSVSITLLGESDTWVTIAFHRSITVAGGQRESSMWENEIELSQSSNPRRATPALLLIGHQWIDQFRQAVVGKSGQAEQGPNAPREVFAGQLAQLTELHTAIVHDAEKARLDQETILAGRRATLEAELEAEKQALRDDEKATKQRLALEEERLESRKKELDDRGHMHARREMRAEITKDLKLRLEKPGVSRQSHILRFGVISISFIGILIFGYVAAISIVDLHNLYSSGSPDPLVLGFASVRFALPAAAAAGLLFYVLGWLKRLHSEDVNSERDLERYRYDLDRASWAIETILEAQGKEGGTVPPEWITGVTHGLFAKSASNTEDRDASDALGSLLNFAAKAEFGPGGPKFEFNKRDLRRLSREAAAEGG